MCFLLCPWPPEHSVPSLIPRQGNYTLESEHPGREHGHPSPGYNLIRVKKACLLISTRGAPEGISPPSTLLPNDSKLILHQIRVPKSQKLDLASLANGPITFNTSHLGVQASAFIRAFVANESMPIMPLCPLCELLHEKIIFEKCARKHFASPQELVNFSLSDHESCVINLVFMSWMPRNSNPNVVLGQSH